MVTHPSVVEAARDPAGPQEPYVGYRPAPLSLSGISLTRRGRHLVRGDVCGGEPVTGGQPDTNLLTFPAGTDEHGQHFGTRQG
ncbi:hypothetical protein ACFVSQ_37770 [Streptomyces niveus]|uniref:hypothetical protein n=1 Tax=Streptomyces niveus TaxID=193462 RepID=UPI0036E655F1